MSPVDLIPPQYRLAAEGAVLALALACAAGAGWMVNGWRLAGDLATVKAQFAQANAKALGDAVRQRDAAIAARDNVAAKLSTLDAQASANLQRLTDENDTLRDRVRAGSVRVRVAAVCPTPGHDVPQAPAGSGVDSGAGAALTPQAEQDFLNLRAAVIRADAKLAACQGSLRALTGQ